MSRREAEARDQIGVRNIMWGSDYPHPEGTFPDSRKILEEQFRGVPQEVTDQIVFRNAADLYGIALPDAEGRGGGRSRVPEA